MAGSSVTTPGAISPEDLRDALRCLTRRWSGLDTPAGNGVSKSESTGHPKPAEDKSQITSPRGLAENLQAIILPHPQESSRDTELPTKVSAGIAFTENLTATPKLGIPDLQSTNKTNVISKIVEELKHCADEFNGKHKNQLDELLLGEACAYIRDYSPSAASTLVAEIVLPIVGEGVTTLWKAIGAVAVIRAVLEMAPGRFRPDETEELARNAEDLANDLLEPVMETGGEPDDNLLYNRDQKLSALPQPEQMTIKRCLAENYDQGKPGWQSFAEVNLGGRVDEDMTIDLFWIVLAEENYTIGKLYGHLIAAGLFRAAHRLEA